MSGPHERREPACRPAQVRLSGTSEPKGSTAGGLAEVLAFDIDAALREAKLQPLPPPEVRAAARRRNKLAAFRFLQSAARRGVRTPDDADSDELLAQLRRDALREAGLDERLVREVR